MFVAVKELAHHIHILIKLEADYVNGRTENKCLINSQKDHFKV